MNVAVAVQVGDGVAVRVGVGDADPVTQLPFWQVPPGQLVPLVFGVTEQLEVPLQLRVLHWSSVHVIDVPAHTPLELQVSL